MEKTPKLTRKGRSEINLTRTCSGTSFNLDELMFKSPSANLTPKRKRKRHRTDDDNISLSSLSSVDTSMDQEPQKRRRSLLKFSTSVSNLLSPKNPVKNPVKKVGQAIQIGLKRSLSWKNIMSPSNHKVYKGPQPTPPKRRESTFWVETVQSETLQEFSHSQLERQEAIFELYKNEEDLIEDLNMVKSTYHDSMAKLKLLTEHELKQIFGPIDTLKPLHQDLVENLREMRRPDGITECIGQVLLNWVPRLDCYVPYCSNQIYAKHLLDLKKQDPNVDDFLQRCQDSPFSRRLDLWSFLDVPRSRLVKYPLLFRNVLKRTPEDHPDVPLIEEAIKVVEGVIDVVDKKTGEAKCRFIRSKLEYLDEKTQRNALIEESNVILCDGVLKNNRGTKLHVFLFEKILVLTRPATRGQNNKLRYQVYRQPIPMDSLVLDEDAQSKAGSFRSAFSHNNTANNKMFFKVSFKNLKDGQSHTLQANDEHDKRQWVTCIKSLLKDAGSSSEGETTTHVDPEDGAMRAKRRDSTCSEAISHDGSVSPTCSLRSSSSGVNLSPQSLRYNIRRSTSRTSSLFNIDSDGDEDCEFETKPIPRDTVSYTIRRSFRRSGKRSSVDSAVSSTMGSLSVNSPLSASLVDIPAADEESDDSVFGTAGVNLASPEMDCSLNGSLVSLRSQLDTIEEVNSSTSSTPDKTLDLDQAVGAGKKRKSSLDLSILSKGHKSKRRSIAKAKRDSAASLQEYKV